MFSLENIAEDRAATVYFFFTASLSTLPGVNLATLPAEW
jgi:hypothetical protein